MKAPSLQHRPVHLTGSSTSWLARAPPSLLSWTANRQLVPSLRAAFDGLTIINQLGLAVAPPAQACRPAATPAAVSAATAAAVAHGSFTAADADDASTTRARLYALYDFVSAHQRLPEVQDSHQGIAVGQWAEKCRQLHQQQGLEPDLVTALQSIPDWDWQPQVSTISDNFHTNLRLLVSYAQKYGPPPLRSARSHTAPSRRRLTPSIKEVQTAMKIRQQLMEQRKRGVLTQQQIDDIADTVRGWRWDQRIRSPALEETISNLQAFHQQHGHLPRPDDKLEDGFNIGEWCMTRRGEYSRGQLEVDVAAALESQVPGWLWNRLDNVFEKNLEALVAFVTANGRTPTQRETWEDVRVGAWCNKRRLQYKAGTLAADRVAALEAVPGWWWSCEQMLEL